MANFSYSDINKHDFGYIKLFLEKIKNNEKITINNIATLLDFKDPIIQEINNLIQKNISPLSFIKNNFKIWTKIDKSPFSGSNGSRKKSATDESELGVIIWLDIINQFNIVKYDKVFESYLLTYKPENAKFKSNNDIKNTINWLLKENDWNFSCFSSALIISTQFNTNKYYYHQNTSEFENIRKIGSKLSKLNADKWNPSDIYLISKTFSISSLNKYNTLSSYNEFIGNHNEIIGISLKKSNEGANHGKAALNNVNKIKSKIPKVTISSGFVKNGALTEAGIKNISKKLKIINSKIKINIKTKKNDGADLLLQLKSAKIKSDNFEKSIPVILEWISNHNDIEDLIDSLKYLIVLALSRNPLACSHWKSYGSNNKIIEVSGIPEISIDLIRLKMNGDADVIFDVTIEKTKYKAQIRSFGSLPQLELKKQDSLNNWITAKI